MANKVSPNAPCPCGSGKKYKRCCRPKDLAQLAERTDPAEALWEELQETTLSTFSQPAARWIQQQGMQEQEPESWLALAVEALRRSQPLLARHALQVVQALPHTPEQHWQNALLWWELQEPKQVLSHLSHISLESHSQALLLAIKAHFALEQWSELLALWPSLSPSSLDGELWWTLLFAAAQSGQQDLFCELCEKAWQQTEQSVWRIIEANALAAWGEIARARDLYSHALEASLQAPPYGFPALEQALLQAIRAMGQLAPEQLAEWNQLLFARRWNDENLLKQRIEYCVHLDDWKQIEKDSLHWQSLHPDSLEARFFQAFSALLLQTIQPEQWQLLLALVTTELFPVSLWNWFLLRLVFHRFHREAWMLLQGLEQRDREQTLMLRMVILSQQGMYAQLVAELRPLVDDLEPLSYLRLLWGQALLRVGQAEESSEVLRPFWESSSGADRLSYTLWLAEAALTLGELETAEHYLTALPESQRSEFPPAYWYLSGLLHTQRNRYEKAADDFLALYQRLPEAWVVESTIRSLFLARRPREARSILEDWLDRLPMHDELWYALLLARWLTEEYAGAIEAATEIQKDWLQSSQQETSVLKILASCHAEQKQWLDVLDVCEQLQTWLEQHESTASLPIESQISLEEILQWRREAARGLLLQRQEQPGETGKTQVWELELRQKIRSEFLQQQASEQASLQMQQALLDTERHQVKALLDLLSGPSAQGQPSLSERLSQLREHFFHSWNEIQEYADESRKEELLQEYTNALQALVTEFQHMGLGEGVFVERWGEKQWKRLPSNSRQLLQSAEVLYSLLESQPQQDHAPILIQWSRAAEELLNLRLADALVTFAARQGISAEQLPTLGGRPLQMQDNQLSMGAFPFLLAERWEKEEGKLAFNHQLTPILQKLWKIWYETLEDAGVSDDVRSYLQEQLASECQRWASLRNQAAHGSDFVSREHLLQLREEWLLRTPNLFTIVAPLPTL